MVVAIAITMVGMVMGIIMIIMSMPIMRIQMMVIVMMGVKIW